MGEIPGEGVGKAGFGLFDRVVFAAFVVNALAYLWSFRFTPFQDYPDWVFQGLLFCKALTGQLLSAYYLLDYPVPNAVSTVVMGLFNFLLSPEASGKLMFSIDIILFAAGSLYMLSANDIRRNSFLYYLPLLLLINFFFFLGYVNYYFSLGILFFSLGYLIRRQDDPSRIQIPAVILFAVLLYFSHAMSYTVFMLYLALQSLRNRAAMKKAFWGVLPSLILVFWYAYHHLQDPKMGLPRAGNFQKSAFPDFEFAVQYFSIMCRYYAFTDMRDTLVQVFNIVNHAFCYLVVGLFAYGFVYCVKDVRKHWVLSVMIVLSTVAFLFSPRYFVGIVNAGERFLFPALWLILQCLVPHSNALSPAWNRAGKVLILLFLAVQGVFLYQHSGMVARKTAAIYEDMQKNTGPGEIGLIFESHFAYQGMFQNTFWDKTYMPQFCPIMRLPYYLDAERYLYTPIFLTGIFGNNKLVPLNNSPLAINRMRDYYPDQIVIIGGKEGNEFIARLLMPLYRVRFEDQYMNILERAS
jgi:hypothetical protein